MIADEGLTVFAYPGNMVTEVNISVAVYEGTAVYSFSRDGMADAYILVAVDE